MASELIINRSSRETRVAKLENGQLVEFSLERDRDQSIMGNIYKGRVSRVLPGMQAAFLDLGLARTAFLYVKNVLDPNRDPENLDEDEEPAPAASGAEEAEEEVLPAVESFVDISKLLKEGEYHMVQVIKEPMGTKGARLTGYVRVPGRYLVYIPEGRSVGISRRIEDQQERERLRDIVDKNMPSQGGFIIRTVAEGASAKNLKDDMEYLIKLWGSIKKAYEKEDGVGLIYSDLDLAGRTVRDRVTDDVDHIVVDDLASYKKMTKFIQSFLPRFKKRIELYSGKAPIFDNYAIEGEIARALNRKVWLKSGGFIIIDQTEALTAIDVNTGRFVGRSRHLEDTVLQTNLEAAKEIAYQIRLRNLGGIIILDFIDMDKSANRDQVYAAVQEELRKDPVKTQILPISELGLIQMTRKRTQESLLQRLTSQCEYCEGTGYLKSLVTIAYQILRECKKETALNPAHSGVLTIYCHPDIAEFFAEDDRASVEEMEKELERRLVIKVDPNLHLEEYEIFTRDI